MTHDTLKEKKKKKKCELKLDQPNPLQIQVSNYQASIWCDYSPMG
jgi:LEA14-like dessication related protein